MSADQTIPGHLMAAEIVEQPQVWRRLLDEGREPIRAAAAQIAATSPRFVLFVARGTSDHAALYAKYLVEINHGLPAGLVSPSTMTVYGARPDLRDVLYIAVSQSGGSPDLVRSVEVARSQGALTVAVTNNAASDLAAAAAIHIDVLAGAEKSVAATKSYTAELLALQLLLGYDRDGVDALPDLGEQVLTFDALVREVAQRYRFAQRLIATGRGYSYPTAREAALKLMETSYLSAVLPFRTGVFGGRSAARPARHRRPSGAGARGRTGGSRRAGDGAGTGTARRASRRRLRCRRPRGAGRAGRRHRTTERRQRRAVPALGNPSAATACAASGARPRW